MVGASWSDLGSRRLPKRMFAGAGEGERKSRMQGVENVKVEVGVGE